MLTYKLYTSTSNNLDTVGNVEANGTLQDQGTDVTTLSVSGLDENTQYYYNVLVEDEGGKSVYIQNSVTTESAEEQVPAVPQNLRVVSKNLTEVVLAFDTVQTATGYDYRLNGNNPVNINTTNPFTITGLNQDTLYIVEIRAYNDAGDSLWSGLIAVRTDGEVTQKVTINDVTETTTTADVEFEQLELAASYEYRLDNDPTETPFTGMDLLIEGLSGQTSYDLQIRGVNQYGDGPWSDPFQIITVPDVSPVLVSTVQNISSVTLTFEPQTGLDIEYERNGSYVNAGDVTDVTISSLAQDTQFTYPFRFSNESGTGPVVNISFSTIEPAPSVAPVISVNTINDDGGLFNITSSVSGADDYEASTDGGTNYTSIGLTSPYVLDTISTNTTFSHVIRAVNSGGNGPVSNELTVLTKPDTPTISPIESTGSTITYRVNAISGDGAVQYFFRQVGDADWINVQAGVDNVYTGLPTPNEGYQFEWYASNLSGDSPIGSSTFTTSTTVIEPPTSVSTSTDITKFAETITLTTGATSSEYRINGGAWVSIGTDTSYEVELDVGTYTRELRSVGVDGAGPVGTSLEFTIPATIDGVETQTLSFEVIA